MRYAVFCQDKPDQADVRRTHRDAHFAHLDHFAAHIIEAGPLLAEDGSHSVGSLLIVEFENRREVEDFIAQDPFNTAGVFQSTIVRPYKKILPNS